MSLEYKEVMYTIMIILLCFVFHAILYSECLDHPRYVEANTGCKHFDVHGGPENIPVSRFSFDAKVLLYYTVIDLG